MTKKIALEEHFLSPGLIEYWRPTMAEVPPERGESFFRSLTDFGEQRLQGMDRPASTALCSRLQAQACRSSVMRPARPARRGN